MLKPAPHIIRAFATAVAISSVAPAQQNQPSPATASASQPDLPPSDPANYAWRSNLNSQSIPTPPLPISHAELEYANLVLHLSPEQSAFLTRLYAAYLNDNFDLRRKDEASLYEIARQLDTGDPLPPQQTSDLGMRFFNDRAALLEKLDHIDSKFFDDLSPALTQIQLGDVPRIQMLRHRIVASQSKCFHPVGNCDLEILALNVIRNSPSPADALISCNAVLCEYEPLITSLCLKHQKELIDARALIEQIRPFAQSDAVTLHMEEDEFNKYRSSIGRRILAAFDPVTELAMRRCKLNLQFTPRIAQCLPSDLSSQFTTPFQQQAYPPVFPDPFDCSPLLRKVSQLDSMSDEAKSAITGAISDFQSHVQVIDGKMIGRFLEYWEEYLHTHLYGGVRFSQYVADMDAYQNQRREIAKRTLTSVTALLTPTQLQAVRPTIDEWSKSAEARAHDLLTSDYFP